MLYNTPEEQSSQLVDSLSCAQKSYINAIKWIHPNGTRRFYYSNIGTFGP